MPQTLALILSLLSITISVFVIDKSYKSYKKENEIHDKIIKDVTEYPYLAKAAMKYFPEWKEEIMRITDKQN